MKQLRITVVLVAMMVLAIMVVTPVAAWGASQKVAAVDDNSGTSSTQVCSSQMGCVYYTDYESTIPGLDMVTVEPANVNAATLANYDTLYLFATNPGGFSASQKADIVAWVNGGGKLIIWDSEEPYPASYDYSWLPSPFLTAVPGAMGATGTLYIDERNMLSDDRSTETYYIDNYTLGHNTDAVGDANIFTSYNPSDWCVDMTAKNVLAIPPGPTHVYTKSAGSGIIIYCGLDWDAAGYNTGYSGASQWLKKILKYEFTASSLPCSAMPNPTLDVTKVADKATYAVGDTVTFTITVTNPSAYDVKSVGIVDYPPAEVSMGTTTASLGDLDAGDSVTTVLRGTAVANGCDLENKVIATGFYGGQPYFSGGDTATFDIGTCPACPPGQTCTPEYPSLALPVGMIIGLAFVVYSIRKN